MAATGDADLATVRARVHDALETRLPVHLDRLEWDAEHLASHQLGALRRLLVHAVEHSPFTPVDSRRSTWIESTSATFPS